MYNAFSFFNILIYLIMRPGLVYDGASCAAHFCSELCVPYIKMLLHAFIFLLHFLVLHCI